MNLHLVEFDTVSSTNDLIKKAIDSGSEEGLVVRADIQEGGYGRYGRTWSSPEGGLYMSVLLDPSVHIKDDVLMSTKLPTLSLFISLAVRHAILDELGDGFADRVKIKWPNDIIYTDDACFGDVGADDVCGESVRADDAHKDDARAKGIVPKPVSTMFRKLCGISMEKHGKAVCAGIGVNVMRPNIEDTVKCDPEDYPSKDSHDRASVRNLPVYLEDIVGSERKVSIEGLCGKVMDALSKDYPIWLEQPFAHFIKEYDSALALKGLKVQIVDNRSSVKTEGEVTGVNDQGLLLVKKRDGSLESVSSGEAHVNLA